MEGIHEMRYVLSRNQGLKSNEESQTYFFVFIYLFMDLPLDSSFLTHCLVDGSSLGFKMSTYFTHHYRKYKLFLCNKTPHNFKV